MNLLAFIPSPSANGIRIGPFFLHAYGLAYVVGVTAAILIARWRWEKQGGSRELVYEVALWGFPAGLIGGRLYFDITSYAQMQQESNGHWWGWVAIWDGGLGIWGGVLFGVLAGIWVLHRRGVDIPRFMDAGAPGIIVAQAIGRIGNYFNQELFGKPTTLPWGLEISPAHRPIGYLHYKTFNPTFLYELIFDLALAGLLIWLANRGKVRHPGLFALYVAGYSGFRIFEESIRIDPSHRYFGLRLNLYVATLVCLAGLAWFWRIQRGGGWPGGSRPAGDEVGVNGAGPPGSAPKVKPARQPSPRL